MSGRPMDNNSRKTKKSLQKNQIPVFVRRKRTFTFAFLGVLMLFAFASGVTKFSLGAGVGAIPKAAVWIIKNLVPDEKAWLRFPNIIKKLLETALLSVAVTVCAGICAFFFSLFGTKSIRRSPWIGRIVRIAASFFRNVPDVVWAMLLLFSFGQNILTGFFALFFATFGMLTRTFIETIDETSSNCVEALIATGATNLQLVFQGIVPSSMSSIVTWVLFMIETNIRSSTLIGILTATGIGYLFDLYYKRLDYGSASLVVISIVVLVITIELISNQIRKVIM